MRVVFLGTPEAAVPTLRALVNAQHDVVLVITRPDRRRGRGSELIASPVKSAALELGLRVGYSLSDIDVHAVELGVVVAYGAIIPSALLDVVPMLNVHFSLLPRWRGAAPVQRALLAGDHETGVAIISLEATLDTGPVHLERRVLIEEKSAEELTRELAEVGASALIEVLANPELLGHPIAQTGPSSYAEKLTKETFHLVPGASSELFLRTVRLGGAFLFLGDKRLGVVAAHPSIADVDEGVVRDVGGEILLGTHEGSVVLDEVRPEGSKTMGAGSWWMGHHGPEDHLTWH